MTSVIFGHCERSVAIYPLRSCSFVGNYTRFVRGEAHRLPSPPQGSLRIDRRAKEARDDKGLRRGAGKNRRVAPPNLSSKRSLYSPPKIDTLHAGTNPSPPLTRTLPQGRAKKRFPGYSVPANVLGARQSTCREDVRIPSLRAKRGNLSYKIFPR